MANRMNFALPHSLFAYGPERQKHIGNKQQRRDLANQFKDAKTPFKIVMVR